MDSGSRNKSLAVIGAGPKAAALAAKAWVLRERKLGSLDVLVFERAELAAHWNGLTGFTDGQGTNVTPPEKDVGFPYKSQFGIDVDNDMMTHFSWAAYQISLGSYAEWIDRGCPRPRHEVWGRYVGWVLRKSGAKVHYRTVTAIERDHMAPERLVIVTKDRGVENRFEVDGVVFTGPGRNQRLVDDPSAQVEEEIDNANNYWLKIADYEKIPSGKVAVIGGGETAASVAISVLERNENLKVEIINRNGTFFSRGESFFERQLFSSNVGWAERTRKNRSDIIDRSDRALVSAKSLAKLAELSHRVVFRSARVASYSKTATEITLRFEEHQEEASYDRVINAAGFDNWSPFELLSEGLRMELDPDRERAKQQKDEVVVDHHLRAPWVPAANIHVPMISGISRGPGIPGLSSLGMLADAILNAYVAFPSNQRVT